MKDKITKVELQKKNEDRVNIWVNGEFAFSCSKELVYSYKLAPEKYIELDSIESLAKEDNYLKCKNTALRLIERSYKTERELADKLREKGFEEECFTAVIEFLKNYNFINDEDYIKLYIKDKMKASGKNKVKFALLKKGIDEELINRHLEAVDEDQQNSVARVLAEKKLNLLRKGETDSKKLYKKLGDFLMRKGFQWEDVKPILKELVNEEDCE